MAGRGPRRVLGCYGLALGATVLATGLALLVRPVAGSGGLPLFFAGIAVSAWLRGRGPGLVATLLSVTAIDYFFLVPHYPPGTLGWASALALAALSGVALVVGGLSSARTRAEAAGRGAAPEALPSLRGLSVLVVDDAPDGRESLAMLLEECGARVTAVASAADALEALAHTRPDVLVSDLAMPGLDGYGLVARVRALEAGGARRVPALALSAYARREDRERALAAGFQAHIAKPAEPAEIASAVARLAGGEFARTGT